MTSDASNDGLARIRANRDDLEALAESDLRVSRYARALLDAVEERERRG